MELDALLEELRSYPGLARKSQVGAWARRFRVGRRAGESAAAGPGDDAGAVPVEGGYVLLAAESIRGDLFRDPGFAGFCSVTVNVNDIYAMGGRPLGLATVVHAGGFTDEAREGFLSGLEAGLAHYGLPLLGGHTSPGGESPAVAVSVAGFAAALLPGDGSRPGDRLLAALDLEGRPRYGLYAWDTVTRSDGERTLRMLEALPELARRGLASACRDISNPGLPGTVAMMMEASRTGAHLDLDLLPSPAGVDLAWWLKSYPSFGFLLSVPPGNVVPALAVMAEAGVTCAEFGCVNDSGAVTVSMGGGTGLYLDLRKTGVTNLFPLA